VGAIDGIDSHQRIGQYFTFFWRAKHPADLTLRLEYRQANLKNYVQARERYYPAARGNYTSEFAIVGDDYSQDGPITGMACGFDRKQCDRGFAPVQDMAIVKFPARVFDSKRSNWVY